MTENFYITKFNKSDHKKFGGIVYTSDFNTDYRGKDNIHGSIIADRIAQDLRFDEQCRKNLENKRNWRNLND